MYFNSWAQTINKLSLAIQTNTQQILLQLAPGFKPSTLSGLIDTGRTRWILTSGQQPKAYVIYSTAIFILVIWQKNVLLYY